MVPYHHRHVHQNVHALAKSVVSIDSDFVTKSHRIHVLASQSQMAPMFPLFSQSEPLPLERGPAESVVSVPSLCIRHMA